MKTFFIIPVKRFENSKTRLSSILSADERILLAGLMLDDTLATLKTIGSKILVVSGDRHAKEIAESHGARFIHEEKDSGVNSAVALADRHCVDAGSDASVVVPQDLPLLNAGDINQMIATARAERCIAICPSLRYDGTNVLLRRPPDIIKTHYDNNSYEMHIKSAADAGVSAHVMKLERLMFDIDTQEDVAQ
ncbi:MAG: 2-phospho-L-lactate guanylyltransferase, partial [Nitrososphaera sp.]|uniref:2-phospho-L-lactate guanylyltransferase n=1 Tax=Nitrososphaera sp. TaxID=1971748 RepID=UPI003D6F5013